MLTDIAYGYGRTWGEAASDTEENESQWLSETWYRSSVGVAIVLWDVQLTLILVAVTTRNWESAFESLADVPLGVISWYIYAVGALGALGCRGCSGISPPIGS